MKNTLLLLFFLLQTSLPARADYGIPIIDASHWLKNQMGPYTFAATYEDGGQVCRLGSPDPNCLSVTSFSGDEFGRSHTYDAAVSVIALCKLNRPSEARGVLLTLKHLMGNDGSIGASFNTIGDNYYNRSGLKAGTIAWAGYAAVYYQRATGSTEFLSMAQQLASFLLKHQIQRSGDLRNGLITAGGGAEFAATEHQIDAWFFLRDLSGVTANAVYRSAAEDIRRSLLKTVWNEKEGRFHVAVTQGQKSSGMALDVSSWGALFLVAVGEREKAERSLAFAERNFRSEDRGVSGYKPYCGIVSDYPGINWSRKNIVWGEGTLGMALAYQRVGDRKGAERILDEMIKMQAISKTGGLMYSTREFPDFCAAPGVASTGWLILALDEFGSSGNPEFWS